MPWLCYESFNSLDIVDFNNQCDRDHGNFATKSQENSLAFHILQNICKLFANYHDNG